MPIITPGEKLPATYLERFDPAENVVYRISVLGTSAIAVEFHWVDVESKKIKGMHQCIQGMCCQAFGRRSQTYNVPIYVYRNPQQGSTEGDIYVWQMTPARWKKFSDLALQTDLTQWDLTFTCQKRGLGMDWSYSVLPDYKFRDYWTSDQKEQLKIAIDSYYQMGEASLVTPMNYNDWTQLLYDVGYDVQNQCWPGGQSPMNAGTAFQAIRGTVGSPVLPPPPPSGFTASIPQVSTSVGGVIFQPPAPQGGSVPMSQPSIPASAVPQIPVANPVPVSSVSVGAVPNGHVPVVPLGSAPVMPSQMAPPSMQPAVVHTIGYAQPITNEVQMQGKLEITPEELNSMLN